MMSVVDHDLALVEIALRLHDGALADGSPSPRGSGAATSTVAPILIVLSGKPADRARAEPSALDLTLKPAIDSGWRSESAIHAKTGETVRVELVTATPPRAAENVINLRTPLRCADRRAGAIGGRHAARTAALHRLGKVDRDFSDRQAFQPDRVFGFGMSDPAADIAPSPLASLWTLLNTAEANVPLHPRFPPQPCLRRLHVFAEIETGMSCAISTELFRGCSQAPATQTIRSSIRRVPDGATLAVCETVLR